MKHNSDICQSAYHATACSCLRYYLQTQLTESGDAVNVYLIPSSRSLRLSRLSQTEVEGGSIPSAIECTFTNPKAKTAAAPKRRKAKKELVNLSDDEKELGVKIDATEDLIERSERNDEDKDEDEDEGEGEAEDEGEESDDDGERENGWKVIRGTSFQKVRGGVRKSRSGAVTVLESE